MAAAINIIKRALRRAGVLAAGETPAAADTQTALEALNDLIDLWSLDSLTVYRNVELVAPLSSASSYSIGPGADIDADRPLRIGSAFVRQDTADWPLEIVNDDRFNSVVYKQSPGIPEFLRYDPAMPVGRIDLWPVPDSTYELHIVVPMQVQRVEESADEIVTPPGYERALMLALALDMCTEFQVAIPQALPELANEAMAAVKRNNNENNPVVAVFDTALVANPWQRFREGE